MIDGKIKTVGDIIEELKQYPADMMVFTFHFWMDEIDSYRDYYVPYFNVEKVENPDAPLVKDDFRYNESYDDSGQAIKSGYYNFETGTPFLQIG
jgi:hypothetical protein